MPQTSAAIASQCRTSPSPIQISMPDWLGITLMDVAGALGCGMGWQEPRFDIQSNVRRRFSPLSVFWLAHFAFTAHCQCSYAGLRHCEYFNNFYTSRLRLHTPFILFLECWFDWGTLAHKFYPSITLKWLYSLGPWEVRTTPSNTQPTSRPYNAFFCDSEDGIFCSV